MAQCGIHVPAVEGTTIPIFDDVFVDIGDDQSVERDLSTFTSHLRTVDDILRRATSRSLVLMDEVGTGTDPREGEALAAAILTSLVSKGVRTIVTTHHGGLKAVAHETPGMRNAGMEFDLQTLRPTYRVRVGTPGSSYALSIARTLHLPEDVLRDAESRLGEHESALESLVQDMEARTREAREAAAATSIARREVELLRRTYDEKMRATREEARAIVKQANAEARETLANANALIERTVRDLREKSNEERKTVRARFEQERKAIVKEQPVRDPQDERVVGTFAVGTTMVLADTKAIVTIVSPPDGQGLVYVQAGGLKIKVERTKLRAVSASEIRRIEPEPTGVYDARASQSLDLRGMYGDEAIAATEQFLAEAVSAGLERVEIIHGKGTGALRTYVHEFLRKYPGVESFRLADWNAGGSGATVVEMKK
jgi:DNA mismatch repair protein MutS2